MDETWTVEFYRLIADKCDAVIIKPNTFVYLFFYFQENNKIQEDIYVENI